MRGKSLSGNPAWCHLCGMLIPPGIVSPAHHLYGTIDHVLPLSKGGRDTAGNRRPAHSWCNSKKGSDIEISVIVLLSWQDHITKCLKRLGTDLSVKHSTQAAVRRARERIGLDFPTKDQRNEISLASTRMVHCWEDDGGAVFSS